MYYNQEEEQFFTLVHYATLLFSVVVFAYLKAYIFILALILLYGFFKIVLNNKRYKYLLNSNTINDFL